MRRQGQFLTQTQVGGEFLAASRAKEQGEAREQSKGRGAPARTQRRAQGPRQEQTQRRREQRPSIRRTETFWASPEAIFPQAGYPPRLRPGNRVSLSPEKTGP